MNDLKEGEVICKKCEGKGFTVGVNTGNSNCPKCMGAGKLDWVSDIMGIPRSLSSSGGSSSMSFSSLHATATTPPHGTSGYTFKLEEEVIKRMSDNLASRIDQEILDSLIPTHRAIKDYLENNPGVKEQKPNYIGRDYF